MKDKFPLPANVKRLGWLSFLNDSASEMLTPLLPLFITTVLGAGPAALGIIEGISDAISNILKWPVGIISDKTKHRRGFVIAGYLLSNLVRPWIGLLKTWPFLLIFRSIDRVGKGIRTAPRDALVSSSTDAGHVGRAFGFQRSMDHAGALLGSLLAAVLLFYFPGQLRNIFLISAIPALIMIPLLFQVRDSWGGETTTVIAPATNTKLPPRVKKFMALVFFFTLGNSTDIFLLLRLQTAGVKMAYIPIFWAGLHLVKSISTRIIGRLSDSFGRKRMILIGWIYYGLIYLSFGWVESNAAIQIIFLAYGLFYGFTEGVERAIVAEWTPLSQHGKAFGFYNMISGLALLPASILFGILWQTLGYGAAFTLGAAIALTSAVIWGTWSLSIKNTS